jgi:hypothetical protein
MEYAKCGLQSRQDGVPCGKKAFCSVWRQDKYQLYDILEPLGLSAPTIGIELTGDCYEDEAVINVIER